MKKWRLCAVSQSNNDICDQLANDFLRRCAHLLPIEQHTIRPSKHQYDSRRAASDEAAQLLALSAGYFRIVLDEHGTTLTSPAFADKILRLRENASSAAFIIGGAQGHGQEILENADLILSLSTMTLPHALARVFLCEQLYRATERWRGSPYGK